MNERLWTYWGPRFRTAILQVAWFAVIPFALLLIVMLYPLACVIDLAEDDAERERPKL